MTSAGCKMRLTGAWTLMLKLCSNNESTIPRLPKSRKTVLKS